jgi:hypothetical protein
VGFLATFKGLFGSSGAEPTLRGDRGTTYAVSSFGVSGTTFGPDFDPAKLLESTRHQEMAFRAKYAQNRQHDHKVFDAQGRFRRAGRVELSQPLIGGSMPSTYVPMDARRPCSPYRLGQTVTRRFTSLVFGDGMWPAVRVPDDPAAEDFLAALVEAQNLPSVFVRARNKGGGCGTVVLSWRFWNGEPRTRVHSAKNVWVQEWADREELEVAHAIEVRQVSREEWDPRKRRVVPRTYYARRDWTPLADVVFVERPVDEKGGAWVVDEAETFVHGDGFAHLVWVQNQPPDDDDETCDGLPDCDGLYENLDAIDTLSTVLSTGTTRNLDPTLVLGIDPTEVRDPVIRKGSDNALKVGKGGSAQYLELAGTATQAGIALRKEERAQVLEVAQCVVADPDEVAAAGTSGAAIRLLYLPMTSQGNVLRTQYGPRGLVLLLKQQLRSARRHYPAQGDDGTWTYPEEEVEEEAPPSGDRPSGEVQPAKRPVSYFLDLPPRAEEEDVIGEDGEPTGDVSIRFVERHPGRSEHVRLEWPPYFQPTATEQSAAVTGATMATGGKPVMSQKTAVEVVAGLFGKDAEEELRRVEEERANDRADREAMFGEGAGGAVGGPEQLPTGAAPLAVSEDNRGQPGSQQSAEKKGLASSTDELVHTVNELRKRAGDPPLVLKDGTEDPDGYLPAVRYRAKLAALGAAEGQAVGVVEGEAEAAKLAAEEGVAPPPPPGAGTPPAA